MLLVSDVQGVSYLSSMLLEYDEQFLNIGTS